jgi:hypothetical protein
MIHPNRKAIVVKTSDGKLILLSPLNAKTFYEKLNNQIAIQNAIINVA